MKETNLRNPRGISYPLDRRGCQNAYKNKLKQAEAYAQEHGMSDLDMVKTMVIKRYSMHEAGSEKPTQKRFKRT